MREQNLFGGERNNINRRKEKKEWKENNIDREDWERYFMDLLDGRRCDGEKGTVESEIREKTETIGPDNPIVDAERKTLKEEEIWQALKRIKDRKAAGIDNIPMEAWRSGGKE